MPETIRSICAYCGCGCKLDFVTEGNKLIKVLPVQDDEVSEGKPCIKGLTLNEVYDKGRITAPLIRKNGELKEATWEEAYNFIFEKTKDLSPDEVFFVPSGKITNEDNFIMQKFARTVFNTNNVDGCCARLCHIATVRALNNTFGNISTPAKINDIYGVDCLLIIGSNPASNYPVIFNRILKIKNNGAKILSIQNIYNRIAEYADCRITIKPGAEVLVLNYLINRLIEKKAYDRGSEKIENFSRLKETVKECNYEALKEFSDIKKQDLEKFVDTIAASKSFGVMHGMGITQHANALDNVHDLFNLMILKNGKLLSCRGEINVQGVSDLICGPDFCLINFKKLKEAWGIEPPKEAGKNMISAFLLSPVKAAFISGFNPAQSMPNLDAVHQNLEKMFIVQLDTHFNLTSKFASVILPTPLLFERSGTITNGERRIRMVKKAITTNSHAKPERIIFQELAKNFNREKLFTYKDEKEIFSEITKTISAYSKLNPELIYGGSDEFADKEIKFLRFNPAQFTGLAEIVSEKYPFILTTFRSQYHFLTDELTSKSETLKKFGDGPFIYVNSEDAEKLGLKDLDKVEVSSSISSLAAPVKIDKRIPKGILAAHFHFEALLINKLFGSQFDKETLAPNYKMVAVNIKKVE